MASFGNIFRWRQLPPVGLTDEDDTSGAKAFGQKLDGSGDPPTDPCGTDTGRHADLFLGDVADSISVDEFDSIWDFEFFSTEFRLLGE